MKENTDKDFSSVRERFKMDPPENAWSALSADLDRKQSIKYKERGNRFKLLSIGLALLLVSVVTYYYVSTDQQSVSLNIPGKTANNSLPERLHAPSVRKKINGFGNSPLKDLAAKDVNASTTAAIVPKGGLGTKELSKGLRTRSEKHTSQFSGPSSLHKNANSESDNKPEVTSSEATPAYKSQNDLNTKESASGEKPNIVSETPSASAKENVSENNQGENKPSPINSASENQKQVQRTPDSSGEADKANAPVSIAPASDNNNPVKDSITNKSNNFKKSKWSIDASYSPNYYAKNNLKADDPGYNESSSDYNNREKSDYSFAAGLSVRYDLTSHWSISAGGAYSTIMYDISLPVIYTRYGANNELYYEYPTSCGNIEVPNLGNKVLNYGDSLHIKGACRQEVKFISIPVTVRYQIAANRFTFFMDGGAAVNFVIQEVATMNISGTEMTIDNNVDGLKSMNYGYIFGVGFKYNLYSGVSLFVEPMYRGSITSLTDNISFYCYPAAFNINTGLSFHF